MHDSYYTSERISFEINVKIAISDNDTLREDFDEALRILDECFEGKPIKYGVTHPPV